MCLFFKNKKIKFLEEENDKLNNNLLETKKDLLKVIQEKSQILESCISILEDAIIEPEKRSECLLKLGKYKKDKLKKILTFIIDGDDSFTFTNNCKEIASDFNLELEYKFIHNDYGDFKYKIIISYNSNDFNNINKFINAIRNILENGLNITELG